MAANTFRSDAEHTSLSPYSHFFRQVTRGKRRKTLRDTRRSRGSQPLATTATQLYSHPSSSFFSFIHFFINANTSSRECFLLSSSDHKPLTVELRLAFKKLCAQRLLTGGAFAFAS